jgi:hypothetical protein
MKRHITRMASLVLGLALLAAVVPIPAQAAGKRISRIKRGNHINRAKRMNWTGRGKRA